VELAKADHATGNVEVAYDESKVGTEQFREAIEEVGYSL
jgi:copper chaperone CopZ